VSDPPNSVSLKYRHSRRLQHEFAGIVLDSVALFELGQLVGRLTKDSDIAIRVEGFEENDSHEGRTPEFFTSEYMPRRIKRATISSYGHDINVSIYLVDRNSWMKNSLDVHGYDPLIVSGAFDELKRFFFQRRAQWWRLAEWSRTFWITLPLYGLISLGVWSSLQLLQALIPALPASSSVAYLAFSLGPTIVAAVGSVFAGLYLKNAFPPVEFDVGSGAKDNAWKERLVAAWSVLLALLIGIAGSLIANQISRPPK